MLGTVASRKKLLSLLFARNEAENFFLDLWTETNGRSRCGVHGDRKRCSLLRLGFSRGGKSNGILISIWNKKKKIERIGRPSEYLWKFTSLY